MHSAFFHLVVIGVGCVLGNFCGLGPTTAEAKVCPKIDVRNSPAQFEKLRNCTIIMGSLQIVLLYAEASELDKYSFPDLIEIEEYLMVYDVTHLSSLGNLFPNLSIIRGTKLFLNFALIVYDLPAFREIGLTNLNRIDRGAVVVGKCPQICFVDTINWKTIGATYLNYTRTSNKITDGGTDLCNDQFCRQECGGYCWNTTHCQKTTFENFCHFFQVNGTCTNQCPNNTVANYYSMKCMTEENCRTMLNRTWFVYNGTCIQSCPRQFVKKDDTCIYVGNNYTVHCNLDYYINNIEILENVSTCTHINGSVILSMVNYSDQKLGEYLLDIVSISGYLKISRNNGIISLDTIFPRLREIKGERLYSFNYSLIVTENENLKELFNFSSRPNGLLINNGIVVFKNNPQLCFKNIDSFMQNTQMAGKVNWEVYSYSNGEKSICDRIISDFKISVVRNTTSANISWSPPPVQGNERIVGYTLHYKDDDNVDNAATDSCWLSLWDGVFVQNNTMPKVELKDLTPYTTYKFYIETFTTLSKGNRTQVFSFRTATGEPLQPLDVGIESTTESSITIMWKRPLLENGNLSYYAIAMFEQADALPDRNYCDYPHVSEPEEQLEMKVKAAKIMNTLDTCACSESSDPFETESVKFFTTEKGCYDDSCNLYLYNSSTPRSLLLEHQTVRKRHVVEEQVEVLKYASNQTALFRGLKPFTVYVFYVKACNSKENETDKEHCSSAEMTFARTKKLKAVDIMHKPKVEIKGNEVFVTVTGPSTTSTFLVSYQFEYKRADVENAKSIPECITKSDYFQRGFHLKLSPGKYAVKVQAVLLAGPSRFSEWEHFEIVAISNTVYWLWGSLSVIFFILLIIGVWVLNHFYRKRSPDRNQLFTSVNPEYVGFFYDEDEWEMDRNDIDVLRELGKGTFGKVFEGFIKSRRYRCAIKTVNENATVNDRMEFLNEGSVMKSFSDAYHVVKLLGVVSRGQPPLVVMELMERGDLKSYLRRCRRPSQNLTANELYRMAAEVADGMAYLAAKKFVHRDLAARNCMVAADRTVKVGDFGMARDVYETDYYRKETVGMLPVRWMAPESLADGVFSSDSDVWSYGVVLWEMATLAEQPYQGRSNEQVFQFVSKRRGKLERPQECSDDFFDIMDSCWRWRPNDRPTFSGIVGKLVNRVGETFRPLSFCYSKLGLELALKSGPRVYNPPAMTETLTEEEPFGHYDPIEEEVTLWTGEPIRRSRLIPSVSQIYIPQASSSFHIKESPPRSVYSLSSS